jgi:hypothetical protein
MEDYLTVKAPVHHVPNPTNFSSTPLSSPHTNS